MTAKQILIGVAWPYANNELHLGHYAGTFVPADILARYHRMQGNEVLMVSGSDSHGTPITVAAEQQGLTPRALVERYHAKFLESFQRMGITFDLFSHTMTENHFAVVHDMFNRHLANGYLYTEVSKQLFDPVAGRFLPDRYVEGTCPHCGFVDARGDQCDNCNKTYEAVELKNPRSKMTGSNQLEIRETKHFFLDLGKLNEPLFTWINDGQKAHWRSQVFNFAKAQIDKRELHGRAITRDLDWGVTVPTGAAAGFEGKRLYVWYEAVIGYLSASKEWSALHSTPEAWRRWWDQKQAPDAKSYYFIGKDNTTFHAIMWPAMLLGYGGLNLPYDVPANEFLNSYGRKFSKSRGTAIFVLDVLERYQSDALRYVLTAIAPETADADFTWDDFVERVNGELVANWGNLANRVLGFTAKKMGGVIPQPGPLDDAATEVLAAVKGGFATVSQLYEGVKLRSALEEIRALCQKVNQYLSDKTPWTMIKTDPAGAATVIFVALQCIEWLKTMWAPILPESSQAIHTMLGHSGSLAGTLHERAVTDQFGARTVLTYNHKEAIGRWEAVQLVPGTKMGDIVAPFRKLEDGTAELEAAKTPGA